MRGTSASQPPLNFGNSGDRLQELVCSVRIVGLAVIDCMPHSDIDVARMQITNMRCIGQDVITKTGRHLQKAAGVPRSVALQTTLHVTQQTSSQALTRWLSIISDYRQGL